MELDSLNTVTFILLVISTLLPVILLFFYVKFLYKILFLKTRIDKLGKSWLRVVSQILVAVPVVPIIFAGFLIVMQISSDAYSQGCTSGPGNGDCFGHGILLAIMAPISVVAFIVGLVLYRLSTDKIR